MGEYAICSTACLHIINSVKPQTFELSYGHRTKLKTGLSESLGCLIMPEESRCWNCVN